MRTPARRRSARCAATSTPVLSATITTIAQIGAPRNATANAPKMMVRWRTTTRTYGAAISAEGVDARYSPPPSQLKTNDAPWLSSSGTPITRTTPASGPMGAKGSPPPKPANIAGSANHTNTPWIAQNMP